MQKMKERFLVDEKGTATAVVLDIKSFRKLMEHLEELEDTLEFDEAVRSAKSFRNYSEIRAEMKKGGRL